MSLGKTIGTVVLTAAVLLFGTLGLSALTGDDNTGADDASATENQQSDSDTVDAGNLADAADAADAEETTSSRLEVNPTEIVLIAKKSMLEADKYVRTPVAPLTIRVSDGSEGDIEIFHPPVSSSSEIGVAPVKVNPSDGCDVLWMPTPSNATDTTDTADTADTTDIADANDTADTTEIADANDTVDVTDTADTTDTADAGADNAQGLNVHVYIHTTGAGDTTDTGVDDTTDTGDVSADDNPDLGTSAKCFTVTVGTNLDAGTTYNSEITINNGPKSESVPVSVKVGYLIRWPLLIIATGVVVTQLVTMWSTSWRFRLGWKSRRPAWLDLLTEDDEWIKEFASDKDLNQIVLHDVKSQLRQEVTKLNEWLASGKKGDITIDQLPEDNDAAKEKVTPLVRLINRYLANPADLRKLLDQAQNDDVSTCLQKLGEAAKNAAQEAQGNATQSKLEEIKAAATKLYSDFETNVVVGAEGVEKLDPPLTDETLKATWAVLEQAVEDAKALEEEYTGGLKAQLAGTVTLASIGAVTEQLLTNLNALNDKLLKVAKPEQVKVAQVKPTEKDEQGKDIPPYGKNELTDLLKKITALAADVEKSIASTTEVNQPMRKLVFTQVAEVEEALKEFSDKIDLLEVRALRADAIKASMLKGIQQNLASADSKMYSTEEDKLPEVWKELGRTLKKDKEFFRLGMRALEIYKDGKKELKVAEQKLREAEDQQQAEKDLQQAKDKKLAAQRAYQHLLEGDKLAAEIELERTEPKKPPAPKGFRDSEEPADKQPRGSAVSRFVQWVAPIAAVVGVALLAVAIIGATFRPPSTGGMLGMLLAFDPSAPPETDDNAVWYVIAIVFGLFLLVIAGIGIWLRGSDWRKVVWHEFKENSIPAIGYSAASLGYLILTTAIAALLIAVVYELADRVDTWGSTFDIILAFTWGILANRVASTTIWNNLLKNRLNTSGDTA